MGKRGGMILDWKDASADELMLLEMISKLLDDNEQLLTFIFEPTLPKLRKRAGVLKEDSWKFSSGEALLIRVALDIWSGSGHVQLWELIEGWRPKDWRRFIPVIMELGEAAKETAPTPPQP
jgi:hypothetical protein